MRIGVTLLTYANHNIWNNGVAQNVYFLARLLSNVAFVRSVVIVNCGDQTTPPQGADAASREFALLTPGEAEDCIDVAIEMHGALSQEWTARFRARGGKVVLFVCGQPFANLVDPAISGNPGHFAGGIERDEIWRLPKDDRFHSLLEALYRAPCCCMPYVWSDTFLKASIAKLDGASYGYAAGEDKLRVAILEPNISPIKTGVLPLLIAESYNRASAGSLASVHLGNSEHMAGTLTFQMLLSATDLGAAAKVSLGGREITCATLAREANCVISHQIGCDQNYLYFDVLYGAYPLVHNSPTYAEFGYYYEGNNVENGAAALRRAAETHDVNLGRYRADNARLFAAVSPDNPRNVERYARQLLRLQSNRTLTGSRSS